LLNFKLSNIFAWQLNWKKCQESFRSEVELETKSRSFGKRNLGD